ncbi:MAG: hypothetical protein Q9195_008302 [Heterodermia aff. obscurata]
MFSLAPGEARTIIGVTGLSFTSTNFLPSSSPPLASPSTSAFQQTHSASIASTSSRASSTRPTDASASSSHTVLTSTPPSTTSQPSTPPSTTSQPSTSSERHASSHHTSSEQSKSLGSGSGSASARTTQLTPTVISTDPPTQTLAPSSSSATNSNVTTAASPSYLSTHKTGVGVGTTFGVIAALALILGIFCWRRRRKNSEKGPPVKTRKYRQSISPSQILGPPNPDYSDVPPLMTPYTRQSNADINNGVHSVPTIARASGSGHLDLPPNPHPYQRTNNTSSSLANSNVSNPAFRGYPSAAPSSTQSSVPLLSTNNPGASQAGYYGEAPIPHPYSRQEALRDQSTPLIPPTRSRGPATGPSANQPYNLFHSAADSLAQGTGTPPPRYSPRRPIRSVPAWSPESVGNGDIRPLQ